MHETGGPPAVTAATAARRSDAALVRVVAAGAGWAERLPAVPDRRHGTPRVTASVSALHLVAERASLEARGYTFAGVYRSRRLPSEAEVVDVVVPAELARHHPGWWQQLRTCAESALPLAYGPVQKVCDELLRMHDLAAAGR